MVRTKTTSKFADDENSQVERSPSPPQNTAADQASDQQTLNETPVHTILPDIIIPAFDSPKSSKSKSSKQPIIKPRPVPTRHSTRMEKSSKEPTVSHVDLLSDEEKETNCGEEEEKTDEEEKEEEPSTEEESSASDDEEMDETYKEQIEEVPEEMDEDSEQTLTEIVKSARKIYKRRKEIAREAHPLPTEKSVSSIKRKSTSQNDDENVEIVVKKESSPRKHGKGKDITKVAVVLKAQRVDKIAFRPMSRSKYFEFESLKTKGWDLKKFTDPQGWTDFVSLQEHTYEGLVRELYTNLIVKQKKKENVIPSFWT